MTPNTTSANAVIPRCRQNSLSLIGLSSSVSSARRKFRTSQNAKGSVALYDVAMIYSVFFLIARLLFSGIRKIHYLYFAVLMKLLSKCYFYNLAPDCLAVRSNNIYIETMKKTVLVVDDEKDVVDLLSYNLTKEGFDVITARTGSEALVKMKQNPDLLILDIMMPEMSGLEVVRELKRNKTTSGVPVILLTAKGSDTDEVVGLEVGADDYIVKPVKIGKIVARAHAVLRRKEQVVQRALNQPEIIRINELEINVASYTVRLGNEKLFFPKKEFETLVYLIRNKGRVLSRESILNAVWGYDVHVVDRTVDVHVRKIREKLGGLAEFIETIPGVGYRFRG
jgi:two-component system alkaline phosphatase synthesis response regulator PhoP